jgi:hypothetical protein
MKKIILTVIVFLLINVIPSFSFAAEKEGGLQSHTMYAMWILLLLIFILFTSIIFYVSPTDKKVYEGKVIEHESRVIPVIMSGSGLLVFNQSFKLISKLVYILLALYFAIILFLLV